MKKIVASVLTVICVLSSIAGVSTPAFASNPVEEEIAERAGVIRVPDNQRDTIFEKE